MASSINTRPFEDWAVYRLLGSVPAAAIASIRSAGSNKNKNRNKNSGDDDGPVRVVSDDIDQEDIDMIVRKLKSNMKGRKANVVIKKAALDQNVVNNGGKMNGWQKAKAAYGDLYGNIYNNISAFPRMFGHAVNFILPNLGSSKLGKFVKKHNPFKYRESHLGQYKKMRLLNQIKDAKRNGASNGQLMDLYKQYKKVGRLGRIQHGLEKGVGSAVGFGSYFIPGAGQVIAGATAADALGGAAGKLAKGDITGGIVGGLSGLAYSAAPLKALRGVKGAVQGIRGAGRAMGIGNKALDVIQRGAGRVSRIGGKGIFGAMALDAGYGMGGYKLDGYNRVGYDNKLGDIFQKGRDYYRQNDVGNFERIF